MKNKILEVQKKREFSRLPDSIVKRALERTKGDVKEARAVLRKYFGVFLTNKVVKGKDESILKSHLSTKKRDYESFYSKISEAVGPIGSVIDFGCGANGFSFPEIRKHFGNVYYLGIEASGQLVKSTKEYFKYMGFDNVDILKEDLFKIEKINKFLGQLKKDRPRLVFLFQVIDSLEAFEKDFSKKFIKKISGNFEFMVITLPLETLGKRKNFSVSRKWLVDFLKEGFVILKDYKENGERILILKNEI